MSIKDSMNLIGDVAVWTAEGFADGMNLNGHPAHSAIFIINNQKGEPQFINRIGTYSPVTVETNSQITEYYINQINIAQKQDKAKIPTMSLTPIYFRMK